jgi:hypothetical protein
VTVAVNLLDAGSKYDILSTTSRATFLSHFDVTMDMLEAMEKAVEKSGRSSTGKPLAKMAGSVRERDEILNQGKDGSIAVVHNVGGTRSWHSR